MKVATACSDSLDMGEQERNKSYIATFNETRPSLKLAAGMIDRLKVGGDACESAAAHNGYSEIAA